MDADEPLHRPEPLAVLAREDLDRLSLAELDARIAALDAEAARTRAKRDGASRFRSAAEQLFRT